MLYKERSTGTATGTAVQAKVQAVGIREGTIVAGLCRVAASPARPGWSMVLRLFLRECHVRARLRARLRAVCACRVFSEVFASCVFRSVRLQSCDSCRKHCCSADRTTVSEVQWCILYTLQSCTSGHLATSRIPTLGSTMVSSKMSMVHVHHVLVRPPLSIGVILSIGVLKSSNG